METTDKTPQVANRKQITKEEIAIARHVLQDRLSFRLEQKGYGTLTSRHEILGVITEEYKELIEAVESGTLENVFGELVDIAVGAVFGMACIGAKKVDW